MFALINSATCPTSISSYKMMFVAESAPSNIAVGTTAQVNCSTGFDWSDGSDGATIKTATCSLVNGAAVWSTGDICFGILLRFKNSYTPFLSTCCYGI